MGRPIIRDRQCEVTDCISVVGKHGAKGMCRFHYKRFKNGTPLEMPRAGTFTRLCTVDGCSAKHHALGMCETHWRHSRSKRPYELSGRLKRPFIQSDDKDYLLVPLGVNGKGGYAKVDNDYKYLESYQWSLGTRGYAVTNLNGEPKYLHHLVKMPPKGLVINHKNENKLDNRSDNLEIVTRVENNIFKSTFKTGNLGIRGVTLFKNQTNRPFVAQIAYKGTRFKESFATLDEAINKRKEWEVQLFGRTV